MPQTITTTKPPSPVNAWRARAYPAAVILAILVAMLVSSVAAGNSDSPAADLGGDYPAFYGAGRLASEGAWADLYDLDTQVAAQSDLHPAGEATARFFAYPPQFALAYQPLAALDYHWSFLLHTLIMGTLLWLSILISRPMLPWLNGRVLPALAGALLFWPMFRAVTGGSNTALTVFLMMAAWRLVHEDMPFVAGLALSLLLYKPQFALPMVGLFLLARYWKVVAGAAVGAIPFYALGALLQGPDWPLTWVTSASEFGTLDAEINGFSSISLLGFLQNAFGTDALVANALGWGLAAATAAALAWIWWRSGRGGLASKMAVTMPGVLLLSPHAMSHDAAVGLIAVAVIVGFVGLTRAGPWIVAIWILGATGPWISDIGFSPGILLLLLIVWWAWRESDLGATLRIA